MSLTATNIAALPPICSGTQLQTAVKVLESIEDRLKGFPPPMAEMILDRTYTRSEWEMFVKAVRWMDNNEDFKALPSELAEWVRKCAAAQINPIGDDGETVPE